MKKGKRNKAKKKKKKNFIKGAIPVRIKQGTYSPFFLLLFVKFT